MKKYATKSTNKIIFLFILKSLLCSFISLLLLSLLAAKIMLTLDIDSEYFSAVSVIICVISSIVVSLICNVGEKSRGVLLGIISTVPIIIFSLFNLVFYDNTFVLFLVKFILIILSGGLLGFFCSKCNRKVKIK
ncbi:MAG: TIGR04086 family membrane protein [Oscillospiraceae bacterium]|nr:TIGR04086 family membrane protein [Oscillospiraceae bacterium]